MFRNTHAGVMFIFTNLTQCHISAIFSGAKIHTYECE